MLASRRSTCLHTTCGRLALADRVASCHDRPTDPVAPHEPWARLVLARCGRLREAASEEGTIGRPRSRPSTTENRQRALSNFWTRRWRQRKSADCRRQAAERQLLGRLAKRRCPEPRWTTLCCEKSWGRAPMAWCTDAPRRRAACRSRSRPSRSSTPPGTEASSR